MNREDRTIDRAVGEMIDIKRKELKMTQKALARSVGISEMYCRQIIKGMYRPTWVILMSICATLDIDVNIIVEQYIKPNTRMAG